MKYLGGKQRIGKHIAPVLHEVWDMYPELNGYLEPFCGSLGVFKQMTDLTRARTIVANDYHPDLIAMWKSVQDGSFEYPEMITEEEYHAAKKLPSPNAYKAFVGFGMSFGGRYFGAYSHKYLGNKKEDFCKEMTNSLGRIAPLISRKKISFTNRDYKKMRPKNKLIYCDPPYSVTKYPIKYRRDVKHYDTFDNDEFWKIMRDWSKDNIVIISETTAPSDFKKIWSMKRYRSAAQSPKTRFLNKTETNDDEKLFIFNQQL